MSFLYFVSAGAAIKPLRVNDQQLKGITHMQTLAKNGPGGANREARPVATATFLGDQI